MPAAPVVWLVSAGFGAGLSLVLCLSLFSLRAVDHRQAAALSGMAQSIGYLLAASGPVLIGALRDASGGWTLPLTVLCVVIAVTAASRPVRPGPGDRLRPPFPARSQPRCRVVRTAGR